MTKPDSKTPANDAGAECAPKQEELPTPEELVAGVTKALQEDKAADTALLKILTDNILTTKPAAAAVQNAAGAVEALAAERAKGSDDEQADHD